MVLDGNQLNVRLEGFREPVTDSLLSYAGTHASLAGPNAITGNAFGNNSTWGGKGHQDRRAPSRSSTTTFTNVGAFGIVSGEFLQGTNVAQNSDGQGRS